jgi:hypothetical protein
VTTITTISTVFATPPLAVLTILIALVTFNILITLAIYTISAVYTILAVLATLAVPSALAIRIVSAIYLTAPTTTYCYCGCYYNGYYGYYYSYPLTLTTLTAPYLRYPCFSPAYSLLLLPLSLLLLSSLLFFTSYSSYGDYYNSIATTAPTLLLSIS